MITNTEVESINKIINNRFNYLEQKAHNIQSNIEWTEWTERAIDHFGTTKNPYEAGYILCDGQMLDFSGGFLNEKRLGHSEIYQIYSDEELENFSVTHKNYGSIQLFQTLSNAIRMSVDRISSFIYISIFESQNITPAQYNTIKFAQNYEFERNILFDVLDEKSNYSIKHGEVSSVLELVNTLRKYVQY